MKSQVHRVVESFVSSLNALLRTQQNAIELLIEEEEGKEAEEN
jgi:hypothetical protein